MGCENCNSNHELDRQRLIQRVDAIIERIGSTRQMTIPLLQALQEEFSYLPSDALNRVYEKTEINRAHLLSVATFYAQFKMVPYGKHIIKVCVGTACHVKGANLVYEAFKRELQLDEDSITTPDGKYSIEKIACLGCCALAPVVQIDDKIYSYVQPGKVREVLQQHDEYIKTKPKNDEQHNARGEEYVGEVQLGMENCCQVSGNAEVYKALLKAQEELGVAIKIKPISCVGACNQIPMIDVVDKNGTITRYPNIRPKEVKEILLHHFPSASPLRRLKNAFLNQVDMFHTDETWDNILWKPEKERTGEINNFLNIQKRISTEGYGIISPLDIDEYISKNKQNMSEEHISIVRGWKKVVHGKFVVERHLKNGSILISCDEDGSVYRVRGIDSSWREMMGTLPMPQIVETSLIPFQNVIIHDGIVMPYGVCLGKNMADQAKYMYMNAKEHKQIIEYI